MQTAIFFFLVLSLLMIFIQDFKHREVHVLFFVTLAISSLSLFFFDSSVVLQDLVFNLFFLFFCFLLLLVYVRFRKLDVDNQDLIGGMALGDLLVFLILTPLFSFDDFIFFFVSGLLFSLVIHFIVVFLGSENRLVPLAGYFSLYTIFVIFPRYINFPFR